MERKLALELQLHYKFFVLEGYCIINQYGHTLILGEHFTVILLGCRCTCTCCMKTVHKAKANLSCHHGELPRNSAKPKISLTCRTSLFAHCVFHLVVQSIRTAKTFKPSQMHKQLFVHVITTPSGRTVCPLVQSCSWTQPHTRKALKAQQNVQKNKLHCTRKDLKISFTYWWWQLPCTSPRMWAFWGFSLSTAYKCILRCLTTAQTSSPARATWSSITAL